MKKFKGTAICQFNVDVVVNADDVIDAEVKICELLDENLGDDFKITGNVGDIFDVNYDGCFEILDVMEEGLEECINKF